MSSQDYFYALDFAFYSTSGIYDFAAQCQMMKALGYDGIHFSAWDGTRWKSTQQLADVKRRYGIDVSGIYIVLDLAQGVEHPKNAGILTMLEHLEGCTTVNLSIKTAGIGLQPGDLRGHGPVAAWLRRALAICEARGIDLLLYPHIAFWMDRHETAVRLCEEIAHPRIGIVYTGYHWYAQEGGDPMPVLRRVMPYLRQVHLSGSRRSPLGFGGVATIEPLDVGELDNLAIIGGLKQLGYRGPYGYLGWEEGGNPYNKLKRSLESLREMTSLLDANPHWVKHLEG